MAWLCEKRHYVGSLIGSYKTSIFCRNDFLNNLHFLTSGTILRFPSEPSGLERLGRRDHPVDHLSPHPQRLPHSHRQGPQLTPKR